MGISIHYRGTIDDVVQVENMEDRVIDLVFSLGGRATIWRSYADHDRSRVVRGLMIEMEPGQDTFSLLISPEGHLTPLFQIEDAEKAAFDEPPYCFVKTQFGTPLGHVAVVHLLDAVRQQYCSNLEVSDEGEYYETRDINVLTQKMQFLGTAINSAGEGLRKHGLSKEAAEDPSILATRIERIAAMVQQKLRAEWPAPPDPAANHLDQSSDNWHKPSLDEEVHAFERLRRQSDLRSERMTSRIAEATAAGLSAEEAFELAMQDEGLSIPRSEVNEFYDRALDESSPEEPWLVSLPSHPFDGDGRQSLQGNHSAVVQAQTFLVAVINLAEDKSNQSSFISVLRRASLETFGGLVQATSGDPSDLTERALTISQLKRALTGHGFARGAIFALRSEGTISEAQSGELHEQLTSILSSIHSLAERAWTSPGNESES